MHGSLWTMRLFYPVNLRIVCGELPFRISLRRVFSRGKKDNMKKYLTVGTVLKPQGIRGEIKVMPQTDSAEEFKNFSSVKIDDSEYKVLACRAAGGYVYLTLRGVPDRNAAELLRGKELLVDRDEAPELPEGRFYIADVIGCAIVTTDGETLGEVLDVTPARTDIYTALIGGKEVMFPAADGVIADIDVGGGKVTVNKKRFEEVALL